MHTSAYRAPYHRLSKYWLDENKPSPQIIGHMASSLSVDPCPKWFMCPGVVIINTTFLLMKPKIKICISRDKHVT